MNRNETILIGGTCVMLSVFFFPSIPFPPPFGGFLEPKVLLHLATQHAGR